MNLTILQTVSLKDGQKVKVIGFDRDTDGVTKLVKVGWTNELGEYWDKLVPLDEIVVSQDALII